MTSEEPVMQWHAVILKSCGEFVTETYPTAEELAARLKALINHDVSVSCFYGNKIAVSKPPLRYLMAPAGNIPLFDQPGDIIEADDTGYLGVDPIHFEDPPTIQTPTKENRASTDDDFFVDDDEGQAINIFDDAMPDPDA